jgi:type II secretory pathway pseudopilin PulG
MPPLLRKGGERKKSKLCYNYFMKFKKGFTMIEILLVVGIAVSIFFLSAPFALNFYRTQLVEETRDNINTALQRARHNAILQKNDSSFGVKFNMTLGSYTIFQGISFAERVTDQDEIFYLPAGITLEVPDGEEIVFSKLTGASENPGSISINLNGVIKTITVDENGILSKLDEEITDEETGVSILVFDLPSVSSSLIVSINTFTATSGVAGFFLSESSSTPSVNDNSWTGTAPASYTFSTAGSKTLYAWVKNVAGTVSDSASDSVTITLPDTTAPIVTVFTIPSTSSSLTVSSITLTASDAVGVTGYLITESASTPNINDSDWTSSATTTFVFASEGTKTLYAWAKDAAGNISASASDSVIVTLPDITAPVVDTFTTVATSSSLTITITAFTASDTIGVTGYLLTESATSPLVGDAGWTGSAPTSYIFTTEGNKTLYSWVKDAAGNISDSASDTVEIISGLVTHWSFDGDANDDWANKNGTVTGAVLTTGVDGLANSAYSFDGTGDYVNLGNSSSLTPQGNFTYSLWIKPSTLQRGGNNYAGILAKGSILDIRIRPDGIILYYTSGMSDNWVIGGGSSLFNGNWHNIVFSYNGTHKKVYIDGSLFNSRAITGSLGTNTNDFFIGSNTENYTGLMDEVKVYDRALTQTEVTALYNIEKP